MRRSALAVVLWIAPVAAAAPTITRVELVTVTDTTAVLTWQTSEPADTVVRYGTEGDRLDQTASPGGPPARYHYCEITGLRPGTGYGFLC
ncbi:MAG: fibronectin type III domain-containing protein, partial [Phycisphaerae bacterium]